MNKMDFKEAFKTYTRIMEFDQENILFTSLLYTKLGQCIFRFI